MNHRDLFTSETATLRSAMSQLDATARGMLMIVDDNSRLINTVTDGDIRRAILAGGTLDHTLQVIVAAKESRNKMPVAAAEQATPEELRALMILHTVRQIPLVDENRVVVGLATLDDVIAPPSITEAVIMAGGFGKRLHPLTEETPKPMLHVGDRPLLQRTIENLRNSGIGEVNISTHFAAEKIHEHFGDGAGFGVSVNYLEEEKPLGTAGALAMLRHKSNRFLVVNGDILTGVDFRALGNFHEEHLAELTVCVRQYGLEVPYGVIECEGEFVTTVREKPRYEFIVNAGIYLVEPTALDLIPADTTFNMTDLIDSLIQAGRKVACFPIVEYWLDIGHLSDYEQAQKDVVDGKLKQ